jgi:hypothetical protein
LIEETELNKQNMILNKQLAQKPSDPVYFLPAKHLSIISILMHIGVQTKKKHSKQIEMVDIIHPIFLFNFFAFR